jgi:hypothetical protein
MLMTGKSSQHCLLEVVDPSRILRQLDTGGRSWNLGPEFEGPAAGSLRHALLRQGVVQGSSGVVAQALGERFVDWWNPESVRLVMKVVESLDLPTSPFL